MKHFYCSVLVLAPAKALMVHAELAVLAVAPVHVPHATCNTLPHPMLFLYLRKNPCRATLALAWTQALAAPSGTRGLACPESKP